MRRVPIACCLEEGGEWRPWVEGSSAPIRIYDDGHVEDDLSGVCRDYDPATIKLVRFKVRDIARREKRST